jgi:F-type H+-transporting ATPase subunit b
MPALTRRLFAALAAFTVASSPVLVLAQDHEPDHAATEQAPAEPSSAVVHGSDAPPKEAHGAATEEHAGHGGHHAPSAMNWAEFGKKTPPFVAVLINFAILAFAYYKFGKNPVKAALVARKEGIAKEIEEANRMLKEAEERAKVYQSKLSNVEQELEMAKRALAEAGKGDRDRMLREAQEKAERLQRDAKFLIEQEVKQMRQDLTREAIELASKAAEKLLAQRVSQEDHERLADEFLAQLESPHASAQVSGRGAP